MLLRVLFVLMKRSILTPIQAALLRKLALRYKGPAKPKPPKPWCSRTADELWWKVLTAIATQGNARAGFVIEGSYEAKRQTSLSWLKAFRTDDRELLRHIHWVLATVGTRYIRKSFSKDPKSKAAYQNYRTLVKAGGPKRFFLSIAKQGTEIARIEALQDELSFYGPKTARDTAIDLGLAKNCMALDTRLRKLLAAVNAHTDGASYMDIEKALISKVAWPIKLTGAQLDRILFWNYDKILADIRLAAGRR
jgi:hypothetical protein